MLLQQSDVLFWHSDQVLFDKMPSVLTQIIGLFTVGVHYHQSKTKIKDRHFTVQRNVKYNLDKCLIPCQSFDLKGKSDRHDKPTKKEDEEEDDAIEEEEEVSESQSDSSEASDELPMNREEPPSKPLLTSASDRLLKTLKLQGDDRDALPEQAQNFQRMRSETRKFIGQTALDKEFREWTKGKPLGLPPADLMYLEAAIWNDTILLNKQQLVDYSLLIAVAEPEEEHDGRSHDVGGRAGMLTLGIIDWLRPYTWDKKAEFLYKELTQHSTFGPTIMDPLRYSKRFREAMSTFFVSAAAPELRLLG